VVFVQETRHKLPPEEVREIIFGYIQNRAQKPHDSLTSRDAQIIMSLKLIHTWATVALETLPDWPSAPDKANREDDEEGEKDAV